MSLEVNGSWMGQVEINGIERHRVEVNGNLVYAKRPISFDTNLYAYSLPSGSASSDPPTRDFYLYWNDCVGMFLGGRSYTRCINDDNTTWMDTPSIYFTVQPSAGYYITINFEGWYTASVGGIQITNSDGFLVSSGIDFLNNHNNFPTRSSSAGMDYLTLYAHWDIHTQVKVTMDGPSGHSFYYNGGPWQSYSEWVDYNSGLFNLLNQAYNFRYVPSTCTTYLPSTTRPYSDGPGKAGWGYSIYASDLITGAPRVTSPTHVYVCYYALQIWRNFKTDAYKWKEYGDDDVPVSQYTLYNDAPSWASDYWPSSSNYTVLYFNDVHAHYVSA